MTFFRRWGGLALPVLLLVVFLFVMVGAASAGEDQSVVSTARGPVLVNPYVSEAVYPADTHGLPPAEPPQIEDAAPRPLRPPVSRPRSDLPALEPGGFDPAVQVSSAMLSMPPTIMNFEGTSATGVFPPDTNGVVGLDHYVQIVNADSTGSWVKIWDKETGVELYSFGMGNLWPSGDACHDDAYGDPVVLYDQLADRWLLTQFALPDPPYYECIAVSKGGTPTNNPNDWHLYSFLVHNTKMNDYPKLGVWPDGYYMSANQFTSVWAGAGVWVFERDKMLNGTAARFQYFDVWNLDQDYGGLLPSNLMGSRLPPAGAPNYFISVDMDWSGSNDILHIFEFHTDWVTLANSSFGLVADLVVLPFDWNFSGTSGAEVPQPGTSQGLDNLADRLMMHLWYRNFGDHESLVVNHTVDAGVNHHGVRWYEIRGGAVDDTLADATLYQQSTYAPDAEHRWMGSVAMDLVGNMAVGYSVSSQTVYPGIRYAGRLVTDPLNDLSQGEATIIDGSGSQTGSDYYGRGRWGDYTSMSVDPEDDCTFWYTNEYMETTSSAGWQTRVASFKFPNCFAEPVLSIAKTSAAETVEAGTLLLYTIVVTNAGGQASGVTISDTLPPNTAFAQADNGGALIGGDVLWTGLTVPSSDELTVTYAVTVSCVPSGTEIVNDGYTVYASEWPTPTYGPPVAVTVLEEGVMAAFSHPSPLAIDWPVPFTNLSQNATDYEWAFGDGAGSYEVNPSHTYIGATGDYTVVLTASNICTLDVYSRSLAVEQFDVEVTPPTAALSRDPGQVATYTLWLTNHGTIRDTFQLSTAGGQWPTQLSTAMLDLDPEEGAEITVEVTVPAGANGGAEDSITLLARSLSDPRLPAASDQAALTTTANTLYGVEFGPALLAQSGAPGEIVAYTLRVTNTSNMLDTITFARTTPGWVTTVSPPSMAIARGGVRQVMVYVTIPDIYQGQALDVAVIRATGSGGHDEVTLRTQAMWSLYLPLLLRTAP